MPVARDATNISTLGMSLIIIEIIIYKKKKLIKRILRPVKLLAVNKKSFK